MGCRCKFEEGVGGDFWLCVCVCVSARARACVRACMRVYIYIYIRMWKWWWCGCGFLLNVHVCSCGGVDVRVRNYLLNFTVHTRHPHKQQVGCCCSRISSVTCCWLENFTQDKSRALKSDTATPTFLNYLSIDVCVHFCTHYIPSGVAVM